MEKNIFCILNRRIPSIALEEVHSFKSKLNMNIFRLACIIINFERLKLF